MIRFKDYFILNELKETKTILSLLMKKLGTDEEEARDIIRHWKEIESHINSEVVDELFDDQIPCPTLSDEELYKIARRENPKIMMMDVPEKEWRLQQARIQHHKPVSDIKNPKDIFAWISKCRSPEHARTAVWGVIDTVLQKIKDKKEFEGDESDYDIVFQNDKVMVAKPNNTATSCRLGQNTKWCTASTTASNMFNDYMERGVTLFYFLPKDSNEEKLALEVGDRRPVAYDSQDQEIPINVPFDRFDVPFDILPLTV
jgi:hypothetical protein